MSEKNKNKSLSQKVFGAENNSAASIGEKKLGKYSDIAIRMFHTRVLKPSEMLLPAIGELAGVDFSLILIGMNCLWFLAEWYFAKKKDLPQ